MWLIRWLWRDFLRRWREIRDCPDCYGVGLPGPANPDDIITAPLEDETWEDMSTTIVVRRIDPDSDEPVDINREEIN